MFFLSNRLKANYSLFNVIFSCIEVAFDLHFTSYAMVFISSIQYL